MKELYFAIYAIKKNIQSSAELRTSFLMNIIGMAINNTAFIVIWVYFVKSVGVVGGWTAIDIVGLQGFIGMCYGIVFFLGTGIRNLASYTASGAFDRFMLSPKNLIIRVATSAINVSALGDIVYGVVCLLVYTIIIHASFYQIFLIIFLIIVTTVTLLSVVIAIYSLSFFFTDANSVTGSLLDLFVSPALFHGGAFQGATRLIFTFIVPSLLLGALPVEIVRDVSLNKLLLVSVLAILWFIGANKFFYYAVKRYESSNFMTFGN